MTEEHYSEDIFITLSKYIDKKNFIGASKYLALQYALGNTSLKRLGALLLASKEFKDNEYLAEPIKLVEKKFMELIDAAGNRKNNS